MSRSRNIKPGFFKSEHLAECSPLARILFAGLWCEADRAGRLEDRPKRLKVECLPYDDCDVDKLLNELAWHGFVIRYVVSGQSYIAIPKFEKHQNPHVREAASSIPAPDEHSACTVLAPVEHGTSPADSSFLIPDSKKQKLPPTAGEKPPPEPDPIFGHGLAFLRSKGVPERGARSFLGAMRKACGDMLAAELLSLAEREDVSDPIPWLRRAYESRNGTGPPKSAGPTSKAGQAIQMLEGMKNGREKPDPRTPATPVVLGS